MEERSKMEDEGQTGTLPSDSSFSPTPSRVRGSSGPRMDTDRRELGSTWWQRWALGDFRERTGAADRGPHVSLPLNRPRSSAQAHTRQVQLARSRPQKGTECSREGW